MNKKKYKLPLVSIITVVYNRANTIEQCIKSVAEQTYPNIEYIIIDGESNDGTVEIINNNMEHVDQFISEQDTGIYNAMNKGIKLSKGEYVLLLNSDDWYHKETVSLLIAAASKTTSCSIIHANALAIGETGKATYEIKPWLNDGIYTRGMPLRHETMLVPRKIYENYGIYNERYRILADYEFVIRLYKKNISFEHVDTALLYFRVNGISNTDIIKLQEERKLLFKTLFPFLDEESLDIMKAYQTRKHRFTLLAKNGRKSRLYSQSILYNIKSHFIRSAIILFCELLYINQRWINLILRK